MLCFRQRDDLKNRFSFIFLNVLLDPFKINCASENNFQQLYVSEDFLSPTGMYMNGDVNKKCVDYLQK